MLVRLLLFMRGNKSDYAPMYPIWFLSNLRRMLVILQRLLRGDKSDFAPMSPI